MVRTRGVGGSRWLWWTMAAAVTGWAQQGTTPPMPPTTVAPATQRPAARTARVSPPSSSSSASSSSTLSALLDGSGFVKIPPGEFIMGSREGNADEQPPHRVHLRKGFEMSKYEVTQDQWVAVMHDPHAKPDTVSGEQPQDVNPSKFRGPANPVDSVSWQAVQEFMKAMNVRDPKHNYRLPTEAEWEYAARAGSKEERPKDAAATAWHEPNAGGTTHPVGQKAPNAWGLYDMLGNVQEWVLDWYVPDYYAASPADDPQGARGESYRVYRGCAWLSDAKYCRPAYRAFDFPNSGYYSVGFRLVRTTR